MEGAQFRIYSYNWVQVILKKNNQNNVENTQHGSLKKISFHPTVVETSGSIGFKWVT